MMLIGCMVARDEADIIELAVRHNLALLDGLLVIDHASTDGTGEILAALGEEGLPLLVMRDPNPAFRKKPMINALVRHALATTECDWIFVIDADEFIAAASRSDLERTLAGLPGDRHAILEWPTYIPSFDAALPLAKRLSQCLAVSDPGHDYRKMALPRGALADSGVEIGLGQHWLDAGRPDAVIAPGQPVPAERLAIAHVPIRSCEQYVEKFATNWLSVVAQERQRSASSAHWATAFDALCAGEPVDEAWLTAFALNYGIDRKLWRDGAGLLYEAKPFLLSSTVRYVSLARKRGVGNVLKHAERLLMGQQSR